MSGYILYIYGARSSPLLHMWIRALGIPVLEVKNSHPLTIKIPENSVIMKTQIYQNRHLFTNY